MSSAQKSPWFSAPVLSPRASDSPVGRVMVAQAEIRVGRDPSCDLVIPEPTVSRRHARFLWDGQQLVVEDTGSSGGTFVNEEKIERVVLAPGDVVRFGPRIDFVAQQEATSTPLGLAAEQASEKKGGQEGVRHLQMLLDVARALNSATVLEEVVEIVLLAAMRLVRADRGTVVLLQPDGSRTTAAQYPRDLSQTAWGEQSTLLDRMLKQRRTVTAGFESMAPSASMIMRGSAMAVATPLSVARRPVGNPDDASFIASVEIIGGIVAERVRLGEPFGQEELAVLESVAAEAAVAIDSARLYREAREKAKIDYEMSLARQIQTSLLRQPPETEFTSHFAVMQPARSVGGDLYHGVIRADGSLAVALGDVSGKGVGAALIMAMVQGLLGLLNELGLPLAEMIPALNRNLVQYNPGNRFVTLAAVVLSPDGTLQIANAGHCPVALVRAAGGVELLQPQGPIIGLLPVAKWGVAEVKLAPGDALVLYSDGISESFSLDAHEFGVDGVARTLEGMPGAEAEAMGKAVLEAAAAFRSGREADDDVTVLALRFAG